MRFDPPLLEATLIRRYKRFLADVRFADGSETTVHCPNSGSMMGVAPEGARVWLRDSQNPKRKHRFTWELVEVDGGLSGINTANPNTLAEEAVRAGVIPELTGYASLRREVKYGENSRIDLLLEDPERPPAYVEVKNVHLRRDRSLAEFPDCVTSRGAKHLRELADQVALGHRAVMLFVIQRTDCDAFALASDLDPAYASAFALARAAGVEALAYTCAITPEGIDVNRPVPILEAQTDVARTAGEADAAPSKRQTA